MIKHVVDRTVAQLFEVDIPSYYSVPKYQREYVWGKDNLEALFDDLLDEAAGDGHFLGTFICVNRETDSAAATQYEVIDGQQRLTTLSLLLAVIYSIYEADGPTGDDEVTFERLALRKALAIDRRPRLTPQVSSDNSDDYFSILAEAGVDIPFQPKPYRGVRRIERAYRYFGARVEELATRREVSRFDAARELYGRVKRAIMVKLEVNSYSDAFTLFESLNNRGKPLTPIDLIKNSLLARANDVDGIDIDEAYRQWQLWLDALGDDYSTQERFFRQLYNAMRDEWSLAVKKAPIALRSNLIRIYEQLIQEDVLTLIRHVSAGAATYSRLTTLPSATSLPDSLSKALSNLVRAEGTPAHILLLYLFLTRDKRALSDEELTAIADLLTSFTVRRNLTNIPATYVLQPLFMELIGDLRTTDEPVYELIRRRLAAVSASDNVFRSALTGRIYEDNVNVVRFILVRLEETSMTRENPQDLWGRDQVGKGKDVYRWTIEHILPQSDKLHPDWVKMLGGPEAAAETHRELVHHLGNLTLTAYNATLGKMSFLQKRDREEKGLPIGYKNQLSLNSELAARHDWTRKQIELRTKSLATRALELFPLT